MPGTATFRYADNSSTYTRTELHKPTFTKGRLQGHHAGSLNPLDAGLCCYDCCMFERFTEGARRTIFFARREASRLGANRIETEHLLLGVFADEPLTTHLLRPASPKEIRLQIEQHGCPGQEISTNAAPPLSAESKRILKRGAEEADRLQDKHIGNEHLLLGMLIEAECYAAQLLIRNGVSLATLRGQIAKLQEDPSLVASTSGGFSAMNPDWAELGIPEGYAYPQLLFNPPSETMILQVQGVADKVWPPTRLYMKHKDAAKYKQVGNPDETTSHESPVTSMKQPLLGFNVKTWQKNQQGVLGNWKELNILDIKTGALRRSAKNGELILPEGFNDCWITDLVALSDDGAQLYVRAGLCHLGEDAIQSKITYVLAVLDLTSKRLDPISVLRGVFF